MILRKIDARFSEVVPEWEGQTAVLLAGGPSLDAWQVAQVKARRKSLRVIAVNDTYLWAPWADVCYAADSKWHKWQQDGIDRPLIGMDAAQVRQTWTDFAGQKCSIENSGASISDPAVHILRNKTHPNHGNELSSDPRYLGTGRNSAFQALNLALLAGAKRIILLGIDGRAAKDGRTHWFGDHPSPTNPAIFEQMRLAFTAVERALPGTGIEVINCSPGSFIESFPKKELEDVI